MPSEVATRSRLLAAIARNNTIRMDDPLRRRRATMNARASFSQSARAGSTDGKEQDASGLVRVAVRDADRSRHGQRRHGHRLPGAATRVLGFGPFRLPPLSDAARRPGSRPRPFVADEPRALPPLRRTDRVALPPDRADVRGLGAAPPPPFGPRLGVSVPRALGLPHDRAAVDRPGLQAPPRRPHVPRNAR